uniref:Putative retrotransposon Ty1-copia subclass protein n=1 Tax=Tanacetum cinerariifolium TaxID=118510 RepID=A0A699HAD8_TANCI|nr:putative retrotransposon Ty1-copia subclass protein [Tanacetum cinerariifolium]
MASPEAAKWNEAMKSEIQSMYDNQVWNFVDTIPDLKTVGYKWIFMNKTNMDGKVHMYKNGFVAKGYIQTHMIDYKKTFSHVAKINSNRIMLVIAAFHDYEIWQIDVKTAFLNEKLRMCLWHNQKVLKMQSILKECARFKRPFMDLNRLLVTGISAFMRKSHSLDFLEAKMNPVYMVEFCLVTGFSYGKVVVPKYLDDGIPPFVRCQFPDKLKELENNKVGLEEAAKGKAV